MNKELRKGIWLIAIALVIVVVGNIAFNIFNTVATPMTNDLALGQMTNSETADTIGRIAAEGKIWKPVQLGVNAVAVLLLVLSLGPFVKWIKIKIEEKE
jgi:hypothetical protein